MHGFDIWLFILSSGILTCMRDLRLELDIIKPSNCMIIGETKTISQSGKKYVKIHYILKSSQKLNNPHTKSRACVDDSNNTEWLHVQRL